MNDHDCDKDYEEGVNEAGRLSQVRLGQGENPSGDDTGQLNGESEEKCFLDRRTRICKNPERKDKVCMTGKEKQKGMNVRQGIGHSHMVIRSCETFAGKQNKFTKTVSVIGAETARTRKMNVF